MSRSTIFLQPLCRKTECRHAGHRSARLIGCVLSLSPMIQSAAIADTDVADAARLTQNPVADVISVPFENNTTLNVGPERSSLNNLLIQPIVPVSLSEKWMVVTRSILPVISSPTPVSGEDRINGLGDLVFTAFLSPAHPGDWLWGVGPAIEVPTHTDKALGNTNWGIGPSFAVLHLDKASPWVYGVLVNNIWSVGTANANSSNSQAYNKGLVQPFIYYNMPSGWFLVSSPTWTVDWKARGSQQWTVPIGGGVGKIVHWDRLPVNLSSQVFYNVAAPTGGGNWTIRAQVQLLFQK